MASSGLSRNPPEVDDLRSARKSSGRWADETTEREIVQLLGKRALPDIEWLGRVTHREPDEILAVLGVAADLIPIERSIPRALERSGRSSYAQIRAALQ